MISESSLFIAYMVCRVWKRKLVKLKQVIAYIKYDMFTENLIIFMPVADDTSLSRLSALNLTFPTPAAGLEVA